MAASKLSQDIVSHVGGIENIDSMTHCMTRLRFMVKDKEKVNKEKIEGLKGVTSSLYSGGQYQIVIGQDVADVYEDILNNYDLSGNKQGKSEPNNEGNKNKKSILSVFD